MDFNRSACKSRFIRDDATPIYSGDREAREM